MGHRFHLGHMVTSVAMTAAVAALVFIAFMPRPSLVADLSLSGTVAPFSEVIVTPTAVAAALVLTEGHSETSLKVADVFERSNVPAGYTVTVSSANLIAGGRCGVVTSPCLYSAEVSSELGFDVKKVAATIPFSGGNATWSDLSTFNLTGTTVVANIAYAVSSLLPQGAYTETLTFTITAK